MGFMEGSHPDTRPRVARTVTLSIEYALAGEVAPGPPGRVGMGSGIGQRTAAFFGDDGWRC